MKPSKYFTIKYWARRYFGGKPLLVQVRIYDYVGDGGIELGGSADCFGTQAVVHQPGAGIPRKIRVKLHLLPQEEKKFQRNVYYWRAEGGLEGFGGSAAVEFVRGVEKPAPEIAHVYGWRGRGGIVLGGASRISVVDSAVEGQLAAEDEELLLLDLDYAS